MFPGGFEPEIPAIKPPRTDKLDRTATRIGMNEMLSSDILRLR